MWGKARSIFRDGVGVLNLEVQFVKVVGNTAWIASQVAEGSNYTGHSNGNWYVYKVIDNGEPGVGHDTIAGAGLAGDAATAFAMVANGGTPQSLDNLFQTTNLLITSGNIQVHQ
jgi:hypothetical protein